VKRPTPQDPKRGAPKRDSVRLGIPPSRLGTPAFTLVEVMVWIAVIAILVSLVSWVLVSITGSMRQARGAVDNAQVRISVLERLGADVRSSARILAQEGNRKSDETNLILESPSGDPERVLYRFEGGILYRETRTGGSTRVTPIGRIARLAFRYDQGGRAAGAPEPARSGWGTPRWVEVEMPGAGSRSLRARFYLLPAVLVAPSSDRPTAPSEVEGRTNAEGTP